MKRHHRVVGDVEVVQPLVAQVGVDDALLPGAVVGDGVGVVEALPKTNCSRTPESRSASTTSRRTSSSGRSTPGGAPSGSWRGRSRRRTARRAAAGTRGRRTPGGRSGRARPCRSGRAAPALHDARALQGTGRGLRLTVRFSRPARPGWASESSSRSAVKKMPVEYSSTSPSRSPGPRFGWCSDWGRSPTRCCGKYPARACTHALQNGPRVRRLGSSASASGYPSPVR